MPDCRASFRVSRVCLVYASPGGNQVDGLPPVENTGAAVFARPTGPEHCPMLGALALFVLEIPLVYFGGVNSKLRRNVWRNFLYMWRVWLTRLRGAYTVSSTGLHEQQIDKFNMSQNRSQTTPGGTGDISESLGNFPDAPRAIFRFF